MPTLLDRPAMVRNIDALLEDNPIVVLLGARQVGKTTLALDLIAGGRERTTFDLEDPRSDARLADPVLALEDLRGLIVIDEVQRRVDLLPILRVLADRRNVAAKFLLLGSASFELFKASSESLAGRAAFVEVGGFDLSEVGMDRLDDLWVRGGFPKSFLARAEEVSFKWRTDFISTFLQRDIPQLGLNLQAASIRRFWTMLAHLHGGVFNASKLGGSLGVAHTTVSRWLDVLEGAFVVRRLRPWFENVSKRQVKAPKVYVRDSGLLHALLHIDDRQSLTHHPIVGASWEGFLIEQVTRRLGASPEECYFWGTHSGAELDLLVVRGRRRRAFEFKRTTAPELTRSISSAIETLGLSSLDIIHAGNETFPVSKKVRAVSAHRLLEDVEPL